ncbi:MAG: M1 family metallopeptidase, partial [Vicinamibacteria bacterium]
MLRMKRLSVLVLVVCATSVWASPKAAANALTTTQLPRNVRPSHYDVSIVPDAASLTFKGNVEITIDVLQPSTSIALQSADLTYVWAKLLSADGRTPFGAPKIVVNEETQTTTFTFASRIPVGQYKFAIEYAGKIGTQAVGLFALDYDTDGGPKRALYSQFENSDARRMIPSWDEPVYKATFALHATIPKGQMAVGNMPVAATTDVAPGKVKVDFKPSPKMSTYLLFFSVGEFDRITTMADGVEVGVVTRKGVSEQGAFALQSSKDVLRDYNTYFGVPYPLPKLDNVAAPGSSQFFGAMENWGAIFTFEYDILLDPSISTVSDKQEAFKVAAHEISHQWFGDLVTMSWWDDLWLNEGFASWMESRTTERLHPEWNTAIEAVNGREAAMRRDSLSTTHPVIQKILTVEQASQAFDTITYQKGEAVIRMLEEYVGADAWRDGVRRYVKAHTYGSTVSDDLWRAMDAAAGKPIKDIAHDFTLQPGVPLITVSDTQCDKGQSRVTLTQGEFSPDPEKKKSLTWRTPVRVKSLDSRFSTQAMVTGGKATVTAPGCDAVIVNAGQSGYFRTLYAPKPFARLVSGFSKLAAIDQLGVMLDSWALGISGMQPISDSLDLAAATSPNADPQIWSQVSDTFLTLDAYYRGKPEAAARFRKFALARLAPEFARTGWEPKPDESSSLSILRAELIGTLGDLGDPAVIAEARRRYTASASDENAMPAALRKTILGIVARHADAATWGRMHEAAVAEKTPLVKDRLYQLLASTE